jgi:hypothetical protein
MTKQTCPNCGSHDVELREYYDDGVLTDQLFECKTCGETGDKYDFANKDEPKSLDQEMAEAAMMMCGIDPEPERMKVEYKMVNPSIIPCMTLRPDCIQYAGKFVAEGFVLDYEGNRPDFKTRTSLLVEVNIEKGYVETLNSIYWIV